MSNDPQELDAPDAIKTALQRAGEMLRMPMGRLPEKALVYAGYLILKYGTSAEVILSAFVRHAQIVEGLPCEDPAHLVTAEIRADWEIAQAHFVLVHPGDGHMTVRRRIEARPGTGAAS